MNKFKYNPFENESISIEDVLFSLLFEKIVFSYIIKPILQRNNKYHNYIKKLFLPPKVYYMLMFKNEENTYIPDKVWFCGSSINIFF